MPNYILDNTPKTVEVKKNKITEVEFTNQQKGNLQIIKIDEQTKQPLQNAIFRITKMNGELIGDYKTDSNGHIQVNNLEGWVSIFEIQAPSRIYFRFCKKRC